MNKHTVHIPMIRKIRKVKTGDKNNQVHQNRLSATKN